jgi:cytoplasmic iron level regulating protein YaaA (DUF328/UPF0246 family)
MLVLLPPSETKVSGGLDNQSLDVSALSFPVQNSVRLRLIEQVLELSQDPTRARAALTLGPKGLGEIERNQQLLSSPVLPALERYTGVLFDSLDARGLGAASTWATSHIAIFSALFGLVRASDLIPAYRLSFDSRLSQGKPQTQWASVVDSLWADVPGFVVDVRSEGYRALAPVPDTVGVFVNLVKPGPLGERTALGHANKSVKGRLVRAMALDGLEVSSVQELASWGQGAGWSFDADSLHAGRIDLVVSGS